MFTVPKVGATPMPMRLRCREIVAADIDRAVDLLTGFPAHPQRLLGARPKTIIDTCDAARISQVGLSIGVRRTPGRSLSNDIFIDRCQQRDQNSL
jgi:hypothetical protein